MQAVEWKDIPASIGECRTIIATNVAIKEAFLNGFGNQEISRYFKCDHSTISKIRRGHHYPNVTV